MKKLVVVLMFFIFSISQAATTMPESGWWWNAGESGRGFNLEIQNNTLFLATFIYDDSGNATWYTAAGPMTNATQFTAKLLKFQGGQCLTCPYKAPTNTGDAGDITITFTSANTATVTWAGGTTNIQRFDFAAQSEPPNSLLGEWVFVEGSQTFPLYFGERITFNSTVPDATSVGGAYAVGSRSGSTSRIAVGDNSGPPVDYIILLDSSTSYYTAYQFALTAFNRIEGLSWTYLKTGSPSGGGTPFIAFRTKSKSFVTTGTGPRASISNATDLFTEQDYEEISRIKAGLSSRIVVRGVITAPQPSIYDAITKLKNTLYQKQK